MESKFKQHGRRHKRKFWKEKFQAAFNQPPVNVQELDEAYVLYVYAPGLKKEDFLIATIDHTLSISVEQKTDAAIHWRREEYTLGSFKRQFELDDKVDKSAISAKYEDGVLKVTLPKLEGFETERKEIQIA